MITIAYDESTGFETYSSDEMVPAIVAGVVYNDNGEKRYKYADGDSFGLERMRIIAYLKKVCDNTGGKFPADLHGLESETSRTDTELRQTLPEFIRQGTYRGEDLLFEHDGKVAKECKDSDYIPCKRKGSYQILTILKSDDGVTSGGKGIYRDGLASSTYLLMVKELILKGIFLNPYISSDNSNDPISVSFNIPSRITPIVKKDTDVKKYEKLGHVLDNSSKSGKQYKVVDIGEIREIADTYSRQIRPISGQFFLKSLSQGYKAEDNYEKFAFLYLCDIVTTYIKRKVYSKINQRLKKSMPDGEYVITSDDFGELIEERVEKLNQGGQNLFFYYDDIDVCFNTARTAEIQGRVFDALASIYDGRNKTNRRVAEYYSGKWFADIEKRILVDTELKEFGIALDDAIKYSNHRHEKYEDLIPEKLLYIYNMLNAISNNISVPGKTIFRLHSLGISAYSHVGDSNSAAKCFDEARKYRGAIENSDYIFACNKYITVLNDSLKFDQGISSGLDILGVENQDTQQLKSTLEAVCGYRTISDDDSLAQEISETIGRNSVFKVLSSLGQSFAFKGDYLAELCFLAVINNKDKIDDIGNVYFTMSLLLQWYITSGNRDEYEKLAAEYFGNNTTLNDQMEYILWLGVNENKRLPNFRFALFVFIKAFYTFYKDAPENKEILRRLINVRDTVFNSSEEVRAKMTDHPWELVYKYAALLEFADSGNKYSARNLADSEAAVANSMEGIIDSIVKLGKVEYYREMHLLKQGDDKAEEQYHNSLDTLWEAMKEHNYLTEADDCSYEDKYLTAINKITYMYR